MILIENAELSHPDHRFSGLLNWELKEGEHQAIVGPNGAGKTKLLETILGAHALRKGKRSYPYFETHNIKPYDGIKAMAFRDIVSISTDYETSAYQQRWNSQEAETSPVAKDKINFNGDNKYDNKIVALLGIEDLLNQKLIELSSGELRKFLMARTLMMKPKVLFLDNPFIGLDAESRKTMQDALQELSKMESLQLVFIVSNPNDIPSFVDTVQPVINKEVLPKLSYNEFSKNSELQKKLFPATGGRNIEFSHSEFSTYKSSDFDNFTEKDNCIIELRDINIRYGKRTILKNLNWQVCKGEKWALMGQNGAGKSTLLSLICADNPQSYANDIKLFGNKRGSGESIWQIKKHIGYISPEMHSYFIKDMPCKKIIGSGLFDTVGLYKKCSQKEYNECDTIMKKFGIEHLSEKSFVKISSGEQRLCLLARALIKKPDLLILDEPLHGLDIDNKYKILSIINKYCESDNITLIYVTHYKNEIPELVTKHFLLTKNI